MQISRELKFMKTLQPWVNPNKVKRFKLCLCFLISSHDKHNRLCLLLLHKRCGEDHVIFTGSHTHCSSEGQENVTPLKRSSTDTQCCELKTQASHAEHLSEAFHTENLTVLLQQMSFSCRFWCRHPTQPWTVQKFFFSSLSQFLKSSVFSHLTEDKSLCCGGRELMKLHIWVLADLKQTIKHKHKTVKYWKDLGQSISFVLLSFLHKWFRKDTTTAIPKALVKTQESCPIVLNIKQLHNRKGVWQW